MTENDFYIAGPIANQEQLWWNNAHGWIAPLEKATVFGRDILLHPLPPGGSEIVEFVGSMPVASYTPMAGYPPSVKIMSLI